MKYDKLNRRMFLQGAGSSALAVPFLSSIMPSTAKAAGVAKPKFIHFHSNYGLERSTTTPLYYLPYPSYAQPANANPNAVAWTTHDADTKSQSLAEIIKYQGQISYPFNNAWNTLAPKMNLVTNVHAYVSENKHNSGVSGACSAKDDGLTSGDIIGPAKQHAYSTDFLVEQAFALTGATSIPALRIFLSDNPGTYNTFCYGVLSGTPRKLPMMMSLAELSAKLKSVSGGSTGTPVDNSKNERRKMRIDAVIEDFKTMMNHRRISEVDKKRLAEAAELWYAAEKGITITPPMAASCGQVPNVPTENNWTVRHKAGLDMVALALSCGLTRTVAYGLLQAGPSLDDQGVLHGWHHDSRAPNAVDPAITDRYHAELIRWRADMVNYFATKINSMQDETGAPLLDSSLVVWSHQYASMSHSMFGHCLLSIGGANGRLTTGLHVDGGAAPVNRFHLTNMAALGLTQSQIEKAGVAGFGEVVQPISTGDNSNAQIRREQDDKQNDNRKRVYNVDKLSYYQQDTQRRKTFAYLK